MEKWLIIGRGEVAGYGPWRSGGLWAVKKVYRCETVWNEIFEYRDEVSGDELSQWI